MCERYSLNRTGEELTRDLDLTRTAFPEARRRYNILPGALVPVVVANGDGRALEMRWWGLTPHWAGEGGVRERGGKGGRIEPINIRSETALKNGLSRTAMRYGRCVFPMTGFFEPDARFSRPYPQRFYQPRDGRTLFVAGVCAHWAAATDERRRENSALITVAANETISALGHNRMPAILSRDAVDQWLDPDTCAEDAATLLRPAGEDLLETWPVDRKRLNVQKLDGPEVLEPVSEPGEI